MLRERPGVAHTVAFVGFDGATRINSPNAGVVFVVLDKFDEDEWAEEYADRIGVPPRLVKSNEQVAEIRQARAKAQLAQQQSAMMAEQAKMQKDLASAQTSEPSALTDVMGGLQGYNYPTTNQA